MTDDDDDDSSLLPDPRTDPKVTRALLSVAHAQREAEQAFYDSGAPLALAAAQQEANEALYRSLAPLQLGTAEAELQRAIATPLYRSTLALHQTFISTLQELDIPTLQADLNTAIETSAQPTAVDATGTAGDYATWSENEWIQDDIWEVAETIAAFLVSRAKEAGELKDLSNEQIAFLFGVATFMMTVSLFGPFGEALLAGSAAGWFSEKGLKFIR